MTDRDLLILAAKAAKMTPPEYIDGWKYSKTGPNGEGLYKGDDRTRLRVWNPLRFDQDAFRLSVDLNMEVYHADDGGMACYAAWPNARGYCYAIEPHGSKPVAATRRAIVRAAAEIGKSMGIGREEG